MNKKNKTREIAINHHHKYAKIDVFNKGNHHRDFTYIDDIVDGIVKACFS